MISRLLSEYEDRYQLIDIKLGGESLMALLFNDPEYFKNVLFILDGDKDIATTKYRDLPQKYQNVIFLPGNEGPESLIYNYLSTLPPTHEILSSYFEKGLTLQLGNSSNEPRGRTERRINRIIPCPGAPPSAGASTT